MHNSPPKLNILQYNAKNYFSEFFENAFITLQKVVVPEAGNTKLKGPIKWEDRNDNPPSNFILFFLTFKEKYNFYLKIQNILLTFFFLPYYK